MERKIFKSLSILSLVTLLLATVLFISIFTVSQQKEVKESLKSETGFLKENVTELGSVFLENLGNLPTRVTHLGENGEVLFDSKAQVADMENHGDRKEFLDAKKNGFGEDMRPSKTLGDNTYYYALSLNDGSVIRGAITTKSFYTRLFYALPFVLFAFGVLMLLSMFFAKKMSQSITNPINEMDMDDPKNVYDELSPLISRIGKYKKESKAIILKLEEKQKEFETLTENMQEGFVAFDKNFNVLSFNKAATLLGSIHQGKSLFTISREEGFLEVAKTVFENKNGVHCLKKDDRVFQILLDPVTMGGEVVGGVALSFDVTEKLQNEKIRREFTTNVSHELKTPLTSIYGFAQLMEEKIATGDEVVKFSKKISQETKRLINLVNDIIKISQLDENSIPFELEKTSLKKIATSVIENHHVACEKRQVQMKMKGSDGFVLGSQTILEEMISNLVDNSVKYGKVGGTVEITISETPSRVTLKVKDDGIGISQEDREKVFMRFYRVDKSHSKEIGGTGLGLSIVKHGMLFHKGSVELDSKLNQGTEITLTFPPYKKVTPPKKANSKF